MYICTGIYNDIYIYVCIQEDVSWAICKRIWVGHRVTVKNMRSDQNPKTMIFFLKYVAHSVFLATTHSLILKQASKQFWHNLKANPLKMPRICFLNTSHTVSTSISRCTLPHFLSVCNVKPSSFDTFKANPLEISQIGFLKYIHAVSATLCRSQTLTQSTLWTPSKQIPWQRLGGSYFSNRKIKFSRGAFNSQWTIIFWHNQNFVR